MAEAVECGARGRAGYAAAARECRLSLRHEALARSVAGPGAQVTAPGAWGPWVDGGAWLEIEGSPVDWIYRDVGRVRRAWSDAQAGWFGFHTQVGHPLGVPDFAYAGEVALGRVLADPTGELTALQRETLAYPPKLAEALVDGLWEAHFLVANARKAESRADTTYVAGCLFRVVGLCAHALHGRAGRWAINEKGLVASAGRLSLAPPGFAARAQRVLAHAARRPHDIAAAVTAATVALKIYQTIMLAIRVATLVWTAVQVFWVERAIHAGLGIVEHRVLVTDLT